MCGCGDCDGMGVCVGSDGGVCSQQQLSVPCDEETAALLNDCYTLEEKERLKEEWRLFNEQKRNFERERRNFTEAAIRLGHEVLNRKH